jgi:hypothetical protein
MREGCGQEVELGRLLYVCDRLPGNGTHVVHLTLEVKRIGGTGGDVDIEAPPPDSQPHSSSSAPTRRSPPRSPPNGTATGRHR